MERINHGVYGDEKATQMSKPVETTTGIQFIVGAAPIHRLADPASAVNKLFLLRSLDEAKSQLGYSEEFDKFDLCQSMYMDFSVRKVAPAIFVNVLNPATHKTAVEATTCTVSNGQAKLQQKYMLIDANLIVKNGEDTLERGTDYIAKHDGDDYLVITLLLDTMPESVSVAGNKLDPDAVTASDIIGGTDASTGTTTGLSLINKVYPQFNINANLIICPKWSKNPTVAAAMVAICEEISGVFRAECIIDIPTDRFTKYSDADDMKAHMGVKSEHAKLVWPMVKIGSHIMAGSVDEAAIAQYTDYANDNIPNVSDSNEPAYIDAAVLENGTPVLLTLDEANVLNGSAITTFLKVETWNLWGNYSAAYPENKDPKDFWWNIRRFFSWHDNNFIRNYFKNVDDPTNPKLRDTIIDSENRVLNGYTSNGQCAMASIVMSDKNTAESIAAGKMLFDTVMTPYPPAQEIRNTTSFNPDALAEALTL